MLQETQDWRVDLGLRAGGLALLGLAAVAIRAMVQLVSPLPHAPPGPLAFLLAALGFLGGSAGVGLLLLGRHIFDRVEISRRWAKRPVREVLRDEERTGHPLAANLHDD